MHRFDFSASKNPRQRSKIYLTWNSAYSATTQATHFSLWQRAGELEIQTILAARDSQVNDLDVDCCSFMLMTLIRRRSETIQQRTISR